MIHITESNRRIPTLVQLCQRVASLHIDSIGSLGDDLSYRLVKPVLECCNAEQLFRLEQASPHLQNDTPQIWKDLCARKYPIMVEQYFVDPEQQPASWKDRYFFLCEAEAKRLEEAGNKLRNQRLEAEERKKEREVKLTDRVPFPKRPRTGWGPTAPRTLFQKTRSEASKIQKNMSNARIIPPMPNGKVHPVLPKSPGVLLSSLPAPSDKSRVTVNTVLLRRPSISTSTSALIPSTPTRQTMASSSPQTSSTLVSAGSTSSPHKSITSASNRQSSSPTSLHTSLDSRLPRPLVPAKRDPMSKLFVPKHRGYSQRPA